MKSFKSMYVLPVVAVALTACGGGGGDSVDPATGTEQTTGDSLSALSGRWVAPCAASITTAKKAGTDAPLSMSTELTWQVQGDKLAGTRTIRMHEATNCSDAPLATWTTAAELRTAGTATANGKTATKVQVAVAAPLAGFSARTITINQVTYLNDTGVWTTQSNAKDLRFVEGGRQFTGDASLAVDADGYPTALNLAPASALVKAN